MIDKDTEEPVDWESLTPDPEEDAQFKLKVPDNRALKITYDALIEQSGVNVEVSNKASVEGIKNGSDDYKVELDIFDMQGGGAGNSYSLIGKKVDSENKEKPLEGAEFEFYVVVKDGSALSSTGTYQIGGTSLRVYKDDKWPKIVTDENGNFELKDSGDVHWLLEPGNYYILVETKAPDGYQKLTEPILIFYGPTSDDPHTYEGSHHVQVNGNLEIENVPTGNLAVSKTVTGGGDTNKQWNFTINFDPYDADYGDVTITRNDQPSDLEIENGTLTFTLKDGEQVDITGLPVGTKYTVTETEANQDGYTTTFSGDTGTITDGGTARAEFTNDKPTGDLTVTKIVTGEAGDKTKDWHFTVSLSDTTINGTYGDMTFVDGVAEFTLKHGENKTATGLPPGITYTVIETEADQDGYDTTKPNDTGTIPKNDTANAKFLNEKPAPSPETGKLIVIKKVGGTEGDSVKDWHFRIELSDKTISGTYGEMIFTKGVAEFTLKHGESKIATGLPAGITYTVIEEEANQDGYTTTPSGDTGTITGGVQANVEFQNDKPSPTPTPSSTPTPSTPNDTPTPSIETSPPWPTETPGVPLTTPVEPTAPVTGDNNAIGVWATVAAMSLVGLVYVIIVGLKKAKQKK